MDGIWMAKVGVARGNDRPREGQGARRRLSFLAPPCADVTEPRKPKLAGSVNIGGIARRTPHPNGKAYGGGPQMVEISRDGKRVYWTNSLYSTWDNQFYPDGIPGAEVMANANASGGLELAKDYFVSFPDGYRAHQIRLEGGDCSTDSFCYPSV
jgi:methanethiol oxidase